MNTSFLEKKLNDLPLGELRYRNRVGSTNDIALAWAEKGAPDLSLVIADEQTAGRGRGDHIWYTFPGSGLAFSLIINTSPREKQVISRFSGLGPLSVCKAISSMGVPSEIKWPNDILIHKKKVGGILIDSFWTGNQVGSIIMGIGINIFSNAVPPPERLHFPATSLEDEMVGIGKSMRGLDKYDFLREILKNILEWRKKLFTREFISTWNNTLAYIGEEIEIWGEDRLMFSGKLLGLDDDGGLRLELSGGLIKVVNFGEIHLRSVL